jgi:hypothetical protein
MVNHAFLPVPSISFASFLAPADPLASIELPRSPEDGPFLILGINLYFGRWHDVEIGWEDERQGKCGSHHTTRVQVPLNDNRIHDDWEYPAPGGRGSEECRAGLRI